MRDRRNDRRNIRRGPQRHDFRKSQLTTLRKNLDINCNIGQGFGQYQNRFEEEIVPYITSVNIPCGFHTGDPLTMSRAVDLAKKHNVSVGALIGYPDLISSGEREIYVSVDELRALIIYQIGALQSIAHAKGLEIRHVRAHGFLYKQIYSDLLIAETVTKAIAEINRWITLVGLTGHNLSTACTRANIQPGPEAIIDRRYRKDGSIVPFNEMVDKKNYIENSSRRAREIVQTGFITCEDKTKIRMNVETIHVPSNNEHSLEVARTVRALIHDPKPLHLDKYDSYFADFAAVN